MSMGAGWDASEDTSSCLSARRECRLPEFVQPSALDGRKNQAETCQHWKRCLGKGRGGWQGREVIL